MKPAIRGLLLIAAGLVSGLFWPWLFSGGIWLPGLLIGLGIGLAEWCFPQRMKPLWNALGRFGRKVGYYNGLLLMSLLFIVVIMPSGVLMRVMRKREDTSGDETFYSPMKARDREHFRRMF